VKSTQKTDFSIKMAYRGHSRSIILRLLESRYTTSCRRIGILASALNVPKLYAPEMTKTRFCHPTVVWRPIATQLPRISPWTLYHLTVDSVGYIFAADSMRLSSFKFSWRVPKDARSRSAHWPFKVIRGRWFSRHL